MWWNVINYKSRPFRLISVTTSNNKYRLSDGITGNALCHFPLLIVSVVTLDVLGRGWRLQLLLVEIISPCELCGHSPSLSTVQMAVFFDGELLKPVLKAVYISFAGQTNCEVADVWKVPVLRAWGSWGQQVVLLPEPVTWACTAKKLRKSLCYDERLRTWIIYWSVTEDVQVTVWPIYKGYAAKLAAQWSCT